MLKINRVPSKNSSPHYCDLKPGDVFYFANDPNKTPRMKIKDTLPRFVTLSEPWGIDTSLIDAEVRMLNAELNVSEIH